jgi:integrase
VQHDLRRPLASNPSTSRSLRHSFVPLLSESGLSIEQISLLLDHKSTQVTETVYRHQLRPVLTEGAEAMDELLPANR